MHPIAPYVLTLLGLLTACTEPAPPAATAPRTPPAHVVETAPVAVVPVTQSANRTGTLRARREVRILPQEEGRLLALPFFEGDRVNQGELLLQLDDSLLAAELKKATALRRQAALDAQRLERLAQNRLVSDEELARARTALDTAQAEEELLQTRLAYTRIQAPFAGTISARLAEPGDVVPRFAHVLTLTDMSSLVTEITVSELLLPALAVDDTVQLQIDALGTQTFTGRILRIHPAIDPATRQGTLEIALQPLPPGARPGQLCRVQLSGRPQPRRLIPYAALRRDNHGEFVFTVEEGAARHVPVVTGQQFGEHIELVEGPDSGSAVIIKGFLGLAPGAAVKVAPSGGASPGP